MLKLRFVFALLIALVPQYAGSTQVPTLCEFSSIQTFRCDFTESEGRRTSATGATTSATKETFSDLVIDAIDYGKRTARFIGNAGSETVLVFDGKLTIAFLELTQVGNVNLLSICKPTGSLATYRAAYSRHSQLTTGDRTVSQSYGTCRGLL